MESKKFLIDERQRRNAWTAMHYNFVDDTKERKFCIKPINTYEFYADKLYLPYELYSAKKDGIKPKLTFAVSVYVI